MELLLDRRSEEVKITEEVIKAAAANESAGHFVIQLIHQNIDISITPGIIQAAATAGQERVLRVLDEWYGINDAKATWIKIAQLYNASKEGNAEIVQQLVTEGVDFDRKNIRGVTPLWQAASNGHDAVVQTLLETKAVDFNAR
ncbi:MAG: hypothetical protein M1816_003349, partial [Peltula sp. TS41687]